ncbi:MAG: ABC transporter permease [Bacteroidales bacterium]
MLQLKLIIRNIFRNRATTLLNIVGLTVAFSLFLIISLWAKHALSFDRTTVREYPVYRITCEKVTGSGSAHSAFTAHGMAPLIRNKFPEAHLIGRLQIEAADPVRVGDLDIEAQQYAYADNEFLKLFGIELILGDSDAGILDDPSAIIISESLANKFFAGKEVIGSRIINSKWNTERGIITGVFKDLPQNSHLNLEIIQSFNRMKIFNPQGYDNILAHWQGYTYVSLYSHDMKQVFEDKLNYFFDNLGVDFGFKPVFTLQPVEDIYLSSDLQDDNVIQGNKKQLIILSAIAIFILVISAINYIIIATAMGQTRTQQTGIQKILGATKGKLVMQYLGESLAVSFISVVLAVIITVLVLPVVEKAFGEPIAMGSYMNNVYIAGVIAIMLLVGILSGLYPALKTAGHQAVSVCGGIRENPRGSDLFRKILVVFQFVITIILLTSTIIVFFQLSHIRNLDMGIARSGIITIPVGSPYHFEVARERILDVPGVGMVSSSGYKPASIEGHEYGFHWEGKEDDRSIPFYYNPVSYDFTETYGLRIIEGRSFSREYPSDVGKAFIINRECARQMGFENAIGRRMTFRQTEGPIIGVIDNYNFQSFKESVNPLVLFIDPEHLAWIHIKVNPGANTGELVQEVKSIWEDLYPSGQFSYTFVEEEFARQYRSEMLLAQSLISLTIIAIIIACMGIVGLIRHKVERSKREIAIRKVNGATGFSILLMFTRGYALLLAVAGIFAIPVVIILMQNWLFTFDQHISISPFYFFIAASVIFLITQLTLFATVREAVRINPARALASL